MDRYKLVFIFLGLIIFANLLPVSMGFYKRQLLNEKMQSVQPAQVEEYNNFPREPYNLPPLPPEILPPQVNQPNKSEINDVVKKLSEIKDQLSLMNTNMKTDWVDEVCKALLNTVLGGLLVLVGYFLPAKSLS